MDLLWVTIAACLVFFMQVGFLCLESGLVRSKNSINVAAKNITDFVISCSAFGLVGFGLMFGSSNWSLIGSIQPFMGSEFEDAKIITFFTFQMMFCGTAATLVSGAVAERMNYFGYMLATLLITVCIYPVIGHWAWGGLLAGEAAGWLEKIGFVDFAGSTVVHSVGGWVALAALIILGPRTGRYKTDSRRIPGSNIPVASLGALIIWFGWIGFNGGSTLEWNDQVPLIILNTFVAACWGGIGATAIRYLFHRYIDLMYILNGLIGGLVAVTACCNIVAPSSAAMIGLIAGIVVYLGDRLIDRYKIDDVIGVVPAHLLAGAWGTIAVAIFATDSALRTWSQLLVQIIGVASVGLFSFTIAYLGLKVINKFYRLRVTPQQELVGLNVAEHRVSTEVFDLLNAMDVQRKSADFQKRVPVEPFTEVGQIAQLYNQILDKVNSEMTEKDEAFSAYKQSEFRHGAILDAALDSIITIDQDGKVLQLNKAAEKTFYVTLTKIKGRSFFDSFLLEDNFDKAYASLHSGFTETEGFLLLRRNRIRLKRSDGTDFPAELVVTKTTSDDKPDEEYTLYIRDIARRIKLEERLQTLAFHDPLTHLFNRTYFMNELKQRVDHHQKNGGDIVVFFIDLDGFKMVNDTLGHKAGDILLCEVANRLREVTRSEDLVGRWGGDEFVVIMSGYLSPAVVSHRAEAILEVLRPSCVINNNQIMIKASVGVAMCSGDDCSEDDLLQNADIAMYEAKRAGKDTYRFFDEEMLRNTQHYFNLENALPIAIRENQFYLVYQPKVSFENGDVIGFEALIRWEHPEFGAISPNEFIPILESSSLIIDLGEWVINEAFRELASFKQMGITDMPIAVNISGKHLGEDTLLDFIKAKSNEYRVPMQLLEIEITEGVLTGDSPSSIQTIECLAEQGLKLYIDDFGTGYSSLSYLSKFPIKVLKIDRAFISNCTSNEEDSAICLAIISLARSLKMEIVAEGVETKEQYDFLRSNQCEAYQGYYFSRPIKSERIPELLEVESSKLAQL
jgi:Amt family ammonium transporter